MKILLNTLTLIIFSLAIAGAGVWVNYGILFLSKKEKLMSEAENGYKDYQANFNPSRKTIVVIGRSTSILSFRRGHTSLDKYSFIDKLELANNVLRLSSIDLFNYDEVKYMLDFAVERIPNPDLVIIENLFFFNEDEKFDGYNKLTLKAYCSSEEAPREICKDYLSIGLDSINLFDSPCTKKYAEKRAAAYLMYPLERKEYIKQFLLCAKSSGYLEETKFEITNAFQEGHAMDLPDEKIADIGIEKKPLSYKDFQLLFINKNLNELMKDFPFRKVLILPVLAKDLSSLQSLPVFKKYPTRLLYLDFSEEIFHNKNDYKKNFPDGTHPTSDIQDYTADKIQSFINKGL